jgi:hypothetical protein
MSLLQKPLSIDYEHDCRFVNPASNHARGRFLPVLSERGILYPLTSEEKDLEECKRLGKDIANKVKKLAEKRIKTGKVEGVEVKMGKGGH